MTRVALVTCAAFPELFAEEREILPALRARGVEAEAAVWTDPEVDWGRFDAAIIRSVWDYFKRYAEFRAWLDRVSSLVPLWNSVSLVRWNSDKRYLRDLSRAGVATAPTVFCEAGQPASLTRILSENRWEGAVLKPAVSGGAWRTACVDAVTAAANQPLLDEILRGGDALVQAFVPEIRGGEHSLFFFDGELSHTVLKVPTAGDYRVQPEYGGRVERRDPAPWLVAQARAVIEALPEAPAYARIDGVCRGETFLLIEAELIEPYLFFAYAVEQIGAYADMVVRRARRSG